MRPTGLLRATDEHRRAARPYLVPAGAPLRTTYACQQPIARIVNQGTLPACVGATMCACAEAALGIPPQLSWVRIWTDARRRQGEITNADAGTWFTYAIESLMRRGLDPEEPGEWNRLEEISEPDDLASELAAHDQRQTDSQHWRVRDGDLDAVDDALALGFGVGLATGIRDPFFGFYSTLRTSDMADIVLGTESLGGLSNGHEQRIVAIELILGARQYVVQNSWGRAGGCHLPDGSFAVGCARVNEDVLKRAWDIDVIEIRKR